MNCRIKHVIVGKVECRIKVKGRRGMRRKQPLNDIEKKRGYCKLKGKARGRTLWKNLFGRGYGPLIRQTTE